MITFIGYALIVVVVAVSTLVGGQALYLVLEDLPQIVHALRRVLANEHEIQGR